MYKTITIYIVLFLFCAQVVMAGIDVHTMKKGGSPVDIVHHYIDTHSNQYNCDIDNDASENISFNDDVNDQPLSEHSENSHHGCSGHITPLNYDNLSHLKTPYIFVKESFNYLANYCSVNPSPSIKPPIYF